MAPTIEQTGQVSQMQNGRPRAATSDRGELLRRYHKVRSFSAKLREPLEPEDCVVQTMIDVSPTKWHLAHTSWFFETFILRDFAPDHQPPDREYAYLFNSYYNAAGPMHCRDRRGNISRPTVRETDAYRRRVDNRMTELITSADSHQLEAIEPLVTLGLNHEQQHQELMLTDIKHVFAQNPLFPVYREPEPGPEARADPPPTGWKQFAGGVHSTGHNGIGFAYDNEEPRHRVFLEPFELADRQVTNGEFLDFIEDGGYERAEFWLSVGWQTIRERAWAAPLYWTKDHGRWHHFTLGGLREVRRNEPVCHVSYYEAAAFARWARARLPTEAEWEVAAQGIPVEGNFVETGRLHPAAANTNRASDGRLNAMFGDVWEWTQSAYLPYPGYATVDGALGEYNGKFMCGQMVLRGGSCASAQSHVRPTYRNFFQPDKQWQFSGFRLARDLR